jgi:hypothetical protein
LLISKLSLIIYLHKKRGSEDPLNFLSDESH